MRSTVPVGGGRSPLSLDLAAMGIVLAIAVIGGLSSYITSVACRSARARRRRVSLWSGVISDIVTACLVVVFVFRGEGFDPSRWHQGKIDTGLNMAVTFLFALGVGLFPALFTAGHYRESQSVRTEV